MGRPLTPRYIPNEHRDAMWTNSLETRKLLEKFDRIVATLVAANISLVESNKKLVNSISKLKTATLRSNVLIMSILDDTDARHHAQAIMKDTQVHASHAYDKGEL